MGKHGAPLFLLIMLLLLCSSHGAYVYGDIYSSDLEKINQTAIKIEGNFTYQLVTEKANYSVFLPEGGYTITASTFDESGNAALYAQERVNVGAEDQRVDLVLRPAWRFEWAFAILALGAIIAVFLWSNRHWAGQAGGKEAQEAEEPAAFREKQPLAEQIELDEDAKSVLRSLDGMEGRATQKELKEALKFSDAKLSLILTELEGLGHIKKFKRGRANIIRRIRPEESPASSL